MQIIESSQAVQAYFSVMKFDPENPNNGVEHYSSISVYESLKEKDDTPASN